MQPGELMVVREPSLPEATTVSTPAPRSRSIDGFRGSLSQAPENAPPPRLGAVWSRVTARTVTPPGETLAAARPSPSTLTEVSRLPAGRSASATGGRKVRPPSLLVAA